MRGVTKVHHHNKRIFLQKSQISSRRRESRAFQNDIENNIEELISIFVKIRKINCFVYNFMTHYISSHQGLGNVDHAVLLYNFNVTFIKTI